MAKRGWRALLAALLVVGAVALVACGDGGKGDYAADVKEIIQPVGDKLQDLGAQLQGEGSQKEKVGQLEEAQTTIDGAADELEALEPPEDVRDEHDEYVTKLRTLADDIGAVTKAVEAQDQAAATEAFTKLQATAGEVRTAEDALERAVE
jgi:hypothetical protein